MRRLNDGRFARFLMRASGPAAAPITPDELAERQSELFLRGILFVHDQFGIYRSCHDFRGTVDAFLEKEIHG